MLVTDNLRNASRLHFREVYPSDFQGMIKIIRSVYSPDEMPISLDKTRFDDLNGPPWAWYGDSALSWVICEIDGEVSGFSISRHVKRHIHLHAIYVDRKFKGIGIGKKLMVRHWEKGLSEYPQIDSFGLGVHKANSQAHRFYKRLGYQELDQSSIDPNQDNGLGDWVQNCLAFNDWPLRDGATFFIKFASIIVPGKK